MRQPDSPYKADLLAFSNATSHQLSYRESNTNLLALFGERTLVACVVCIVRQLIDTVERNFSSKVLSVRGAADVERQRREARTGAPVLAARALSLSPYQLLSVTHRESDRTPPFDTHAPTVRSRCDSFLII